MQKTTGKMITKKVLATILSICMAIGATQVIPLVTAAPSISVVGDDGTGHYNFWANIDNNTADYTYSVQFKKSNTGSIKLSYNGLNQLPEIDGDVAIKYWNGTSYDNLTLPARYFKVVPVDSMTGNPLTNYSDAGTYYCRLEVNPASGVYDPTYKLHTEGSLTDIQAHTWFKYEITKTGIQSISVEVANNGIVRLENPDDSGNVTPTISKVVATFENTMTRELDPSEYEVTQIPYADCGRKNISVTVEDNDNHYGFTKSNIEVIAAYPLDALPTGYTVAIGNAGLGNNTDYTGIRIPVTLTLFNGVNQADALPENLVTTYSLNGESVSEVKFVGQYDVKISPSGTGSNAYSIVRWSSPSKELYVTGSETTTFTVNGKSAEDLKVYYDFDGAGPNEAVEISTAYGVVLDYDNGNDVKLVPTYVEAPDLNNAHVDCSYTYEGNTKTTGTKTLVITPIGDAAKVYVGEKRIDYYVKSALHLENYFFNNDGTAMATSLPYNGNVRYLSTYHVRSEGSSQDVQSTYYDLAYQYFDSDSNQWLPNNSSGGYTQAQMSASTPAADIKTNMSQSGLKRVVIIGKGKYDGVVSYMEYSISNVQMSDSSPDGKFDVDVTWTNVADQYYDGNAKTPNVAVKYTPKTNGTPATPITLVPDVDYTLEFDNNTNAGTEAQVIVTGKGTYGGTLIKNFEIKRVGFGFTSNNLSESYTGNPVNPTLTTQTNIGGGSYIPYTLKPSDYTITSVTKDGNVLPNAWPSDAGTYQVTIANANTQNIGSGAGTDTQTFNLLIGQAELSADMFEILGLDSNGEIVWDGLPMLPQVVATAASGLTTDDFTVGAYSNNTGVGTAKVKIESGSASSNYKAPSGGLYLPFTITARSLTSSEITQRANATQTNASPLEYTATLTVIDGINGHTLSLGTDYVIKAIYPGSGGIADRSHPLESGADYDVVAGTNTVKIKKADIFYIEIQGKPGSNYKDIPTDLMTVTCGTDLSEYYIIVKNDYRSFYYNGEDHVLTPGMVEIRSLATGNICIGIDFELAYDNATTGVIGDNQNVGKVYVYAIGKPANGTFGKSVIRKLDDGADYPGTFFNIRPSKWSTDPDYTVITTDIPSMELIYDPARDEEGLPKVTVKHAVTGAALSFTTLEEGIDYRVKYVNTQTGYSTYDKAELVEKGFMNKGTYRLVVEGIGNYKDSSNNRNLTYYIKPKEITSAWIEKRDTVSFVSDERPFEVYYERIGAMLEPGVDYILNGPEDDFTVSPAKRTYKIDTQPTSNYCVTGTLQLDFEIVSTNFGSLTLAPSEEEARPGDIYVVWTKTSLDITEHTTVSNSRNPVKPKFRLMYVNADGTKRTLELEDPTDPAYDPSKPYDYKIEAYGLNNIVGDNNQANFVTIKGIEGFTGTKNLPCTLYYPLDFDSSDWESDDANIRFVKQDGLIYPGATITQKAFAEWIADGTLAAHVKMNYHDGTRNTTGGIDMTALTDYTVTPALGTTNTIGVKTITITGTEVSPNYFSGNFNIEFTTTGDLEDAVVTVNKNRANEVEYTGYNITEQDLDLTVRIPGVSGNLVVGVDYEVKPGDITQPNSRNGLGEGHVTITGLGDYAGTSKTVEYYVVANLRSNSHLKYEIQSEDGTWHEYENNINTDYISYQYRNGTDDEPGVRPHVRVSLWKDDGTTDGDWKELDGIYFSNSVDDSTGKDYSVSYAYNTRATTQAKIEFVAGTDSYLRNSKDMLFIIRKTPLTYSTIHIDNINPVTYNGAPIDQDNGLGLVIKDDYCSGEGQTLRYGDDYTLVFEMDHTNVNPSVTGTVKATQTGNYSGTTTITFAIVPRSLTDEISASPVSMTYTGKPIPADKIGPKIDIKQLGAVSRDLVYGTDFEIIDYISPAGSLLGIDNPPTEVGQYQVRLRGKGNYKDSIDVNYEIATLNLADATIKFTDDAIGHCHIDNEQKPVCVYDGLEHEPSVIVTYEDELLVRDRDYTVTYANNVDAGTASLTIQAVVAGGSGNYGGSQTINFTIKPKDITDITVRYTPILDKYPFTGASIHAGDDLVITDTAILNALGNYKTLFTGTPGAAGAYPAGTDYAITYITENAVDESHDNAPDCSYAGRIKMTIKGMGNYTGTKEYVYFIGDCLDEAVPILDASKPGATYNGLKQEPIINGVEKNGLTFADDSFKFVVYKGRPEEKVIIDKADIIDAATYYITVAGVPSKGTYTNNPNSSCTYVISPRSIASCEVSGYEGMYYYTGQDICPRGIVVTDTKMPVSLDSSSTIKSVQLVSGFDYTVSYRNNKNAGKAEIVITGKGNYTGNVYGYFTIDSSNVSGGNNYDETSLGTGSIDAGDYTIAPSDITLGYDTTGNNYMNYTGSSVMPSVTIADGNGGYISNSNFYITAENSVNPGIATLVIKGNGENFTGTIKLQYLIKADLSKYGKFATIEDQVYTGSSIKPTVTVSCAGNVLREGTDYILSFTDNTNKGKAKVYADAVVSNQTFYFGRVEGEFNISNTATGMQITGYASSYQYTGSPIVPDISVTMNGNTLLRGRDYSVTYKNNTNVGTASITVDGVGAYSGTKTINFAIVARSLENCITNTIGNVEYSGDSYTPNVVVSDFSTGKILVKGSDYTVTYSNNTKPGVAKVTLQALGKNYTGSKTITFKITAAAVTGVKTSSLQNHSMKLSWDPQAYASGYQICNAENRVIANTKKNAVIIKRLASCKVYQYKVRSYVDNADGSRSYGEFSSLASGKTILNTPKLKAKSYGSGNILLRWSKIKKASGYDLFYSTSKNGVYYKLASISKSQNRVYLDKGLAPGEVYYYTIRAYKGSGNSKAYSNYYTIQKATVR